MRTIAIETDTLSTGWTVVVARIPPRVCGAPNTAAATRVRQVIAGVNPDAFDPVPEAVAVAVQRDVPLESKPPNCDGCHEAVRTPRASFPPYVDLDQEDDTGEPYIVPGCATGVCGLD